jgi:hypothetical protein
MNRKSTMSNATHTTKTISRSRAKAWTLGAQIASAGFVFGAVAIGILDLPEPAVGPTIQSTNNAENGLPDGSANTKKAASDQTADHRDIDTIGLAQRFALLDNAPKLAAPPEPEPGETTTIITPTTTDSGEIAKRVRYIGFINDPSARHAFIRIDGKQRIVALGQVAKAGADGFSDLTAERITPNYIVMTDGEKRAQIKLASRSGASITLIGGGKVDVADAAKNGSVLTAEDEAAIMALPPRQQPGARRRKERELRGLSPVKEYNRPVPKPLGSNRSSFNKKKPNQSN